MNTNTSMKKRVEFYLNIRRQMGYQLRIEGGELLNFANFFDKRYRGSLTTEIALEWSSSSKTSSRLSWARRLEIVRCFAKYIKVFDPKTEVPPKGLLGPAHRRSMPHIYSKQEVDNLFKLIPKMYTARGLRPLTFQYFIGLLISIGLRVSEASKLKQSDVDLKKQIILIKETKFHKSRLLPIHSSSAKELMIYIRERDHRLPTTKNDSFFLLDDGSTLTVRKAEYGFGCLRKNLNWPSSFRLYDFRHTFVCQRLLKWYQEKKNIHNLVIYLSTYLGHNKISDTYWYITGIPSLMNLAAKQFEKMNELYQENNHV